MSKSLKIAIVAGEVSGDQLGASLINEVRQFYPNAYCYGIGGANMIAAGFNSLYGMEELALMGISSVIKRLARLLSIRKKLIELIIADCPDVFIGIDASSFNLKLEKKLKHAGILTIQYVSPKFWAWGEGRIHNIRQSIHHVLCLFPFEIDLYHKHNMPATFIGHPLADQISLTANQLNAKKNINLTENEKLLTVLPGSRHDEIERMLPVFLNTVRIIDSSIKNLCVCIVAANIQCEKHIKAILKNFSDIKVLLFLGELDGVLEATDVALCTSGTVTLQAALHKCPMVIAYKTSWLTYFIFSRLVTIKNIGLPNILLQKEIVPEFIQKEANVHNLVPVVLKMLQDTHWHQKIYNEFKELHVSLKQNSAKKAWDVIESLIDKENRENLSD